MLICLVRNEFLLKLVRRELRGDIAEVAIAAGFENVDFRIGPAGPDVANSQQLVASLPHQTAQENPGLETLLGFLTNQPTNKSRPTPPEAAGRQPTRTSRRKRRAW